MAPSDVPEVALDFYRGREGGREEGREGRREGVKEGC